MVFGRDEFDLAVEVYPLITEAVRNIMKEVVNFQRCMDRKLLLSVLATGLLRGYSGVDGVFVSW
ncbi:hypothetical protein SAMN05216366_12914 [Selenomonas ruminantium]|uniref:Uncharacterized protein n=1 Tax=Selenomonas ruminantium TaxID=971 RepID=A0A1H0U6A3_SELRU|nr:hypothetical protein SAMN05216366_12914 [Selenomonas ruminantium]